MMNYYQEKKAKEIETLMKHYVDRKGNPSFTPTNATVVIKHADYSREEVNVYDTPWGKRVYVDGHLYSFRKDGTIY